MTDLAALRASDLRGDEAERVSLALRRALEEIAALINVDEPISSVAFASPLAMLAFALGVADGCANTQSNEDDSWYVVKHDDILNIVDFPTFMRLRKLGAPLVGGEVRSYRAAVALRALLLRDATLDGEARYGVAIRPSVALAVDLRAPETSQRSLRAGAFASLAFAVAAASVYYCDIKSMSFTRANPSSLKSSRDHAPEAQRNAVAAALRRMIDALPECAWREPLAATFGDIARRLAPTREKKKS